VNLLHSIGNHIRNELVLLAPASSFIPESFARRCVDRNRHARLLSGLQRVRGRIYRADGALKVSQLTADGRHEQDSDYDSWHLLAVDGNGEVEGCARYRHLTGNVDFNDLDVRESWLARCDQWGPGLRAAVELEIALANQRGLAFSEVGGWAIVPEKRCTTEALRIAMATYSLARILGGCVGISTATVQHRSYSVLRWIGGRSLQHGGIELPSYYDPQYQFHMEVLRFDSSSPSASWCGKSVEELTKQLAEVSVVGAGEPAETHCAQQPQPMPVTWTSVPRLKWAI
jgi:hypothetical protein